MFGFSVFVLSHFTRTIELIEIIELSAAVLGLVYIYLIAKKNVWAWPVGILSCLLLVWVCKNQGLFFQALVQSLNSAMGIWGWFAWKSQGAIVKHLQTKHLFFILLLSIVLGLGLGLYGKLIQPNSNWSQILVDPQIFIFSIIATILTIYCFKESWYFWMIVNVLTLILTISNGLLYFSILSVAYIIFTFYGFLNWQKFEKRQI